MTLIEYIQSINSRLKEGHTGEHTFRGDLEQLLRTQLPTYHIINEPLNITDCGNPDFVVMQGKIPIGFIEAKGIGKDLNHKEHKAQFTRYRKALDNLIITDYIWFQFYEHGELVTEIRLGKYDTDNQKIIADDTKFNKFSNLIQDFATNNTQSIKSPVKLAELMAGKARLLENILEGALKKDIEKNENTSLTNQYNSFKKELIHDLEPKAFADLYAQTLAYGLFAARYHDPTLPTFDRDEAARLIPQNNPLLRNLFQSIAGYNIDERIKHTVDNLAEVFLHADVKSILEGYGKKTAQTDPIIHFYETFLAKYDAKLRKAKGVWYTPQPVVSFIVRAVDDILKDKFDLKDGLADASKTTIEIEAHEGADQSKPLKKRKGKLYGTKEIYKVQILDPATGTGTFLAEVVKHIYHNHFNGMQGIWQEYVKQDLVPRLNGFEILMASYAMAHLKLDILLGESGCDISDQRLRIFLTDSLEEYHPDTNTLFWANWLSDEAREANIVKKNTPVMVIMGNPPYEGNSTNKGDWIMSLMDDYKKEPGGKEKLKEQNSKWINNDYVKFMRFSQHFIEKNGEGVLAFINSNSFLDSPTFRGVRWNLLKTYDEIYIIDLHGNAKKEEKSPDGSKDENVFDIMEGVSINLLVKTGKKKKNELGKLFHHDLYGKRKDKYQFLENTAFADVLYQALPNVAPMYFMVPKDFESQKIFKRGFSLVNIFDISVMGFQTHRDGFVVSESKKELEAKILELKDETIDSDLLASKYSLKDTKAWNLSSIRLLLEKESFKDDIHKCSYRPFDNRFVITNQLLNDRPRSELQAHMVSKDNLSLLVSKQQATIGFRHVFLAKYTGNDCVVSNKSREGNQVFMLYLYPDDNSERIPNLNPEEIKAFEKSLKLPFVAEKDSTSDKPENFAPLDILDYIYAVLHSPNYRDKYKEFLKTDFPRVPYPKLKTFWQLVDLGGQIRQLHLMESPALDEFISSYPESGDNIITRKITKISLGYEATSDTHGKVWINDKQFFENVPLQAWEFYIGGYQPAQKWLKDRKGRELKLDDIRHYQKIIVALTETAKLMQEVDKVLKL